jgi:hypothetical protein
MIVVQMIGGMGNQMFQYALFRNFLERGVDAKYEHLRTAKYHNGFVLDKVFNIQEKPISDLSESDSLIRFQENTWPTYNPAILEKRGVYLCGNWQNIGYFPEENILRNDFFFKSELDEKNIDILEQIENSESVSIHIRRGDYSIGSNSGYFFQSDWMNYYALAIDAVRRKVGKEIKFFVFSDDIPWAKSHSFIKNAAFIDWNKGFESWKDMKLMSSCKHNITANSTFSWWAAWLNNNPDKIVTTPKRWFNSNIDSNLITLEEWIKI